MKNKKGIEYTTNELISIVIAVIGISIIIFAVFKVISMNQDEEIKNVQSTLDRIIKKVNSLKEGERSNILLQGFEGSEEWYIVSWAKGQEGRPDRCYFEGCICICKGYDSNACQNNGVCQKVSNIIVNENFVRSYEQITSVNQFYTCNSIALKSNLLDLEVANQNNLKIISSKGSSDLYKYLLEFQKTASKEAEGYRGDWNYDSGYYGGYQGEVLIRLDPCPRK